MSQPAENPFLPYMVDNDTELTPEQLDRLFYVPPQNGESAFSTSNSEILDDLDLDFKLGENPTEHTDSPSESAVPTPEFSGYTFGQRNLSQYSLPSGTLPHTCPHLRQQGYNAQRPLHIRSQTTFQSHRPSQRFSRVEQPHHRRSLSHGDAERIAAATQQNSNPAFSRIQSTRASSEAPEDDVTRLRMGTHHRRGHSQKLTGGQIGSPVSVPVHSQRMLPTPIGTPIGTPIRQVVFGRYEPNDLSLQLTGSNDTEIPRFVRMNHRDQMEKSQRIIEIGAMAVLNPPRRTMRHQRDRSQPSKLEEIEGEGRIDLGSVKSPKQARGFPNYELDDYEEGSEDRKVVPEASVGLDADYECCCDKDGAESVHYPPIKRDDHDDFMTITGKTDTFVQNENSSYEADNLFQMFTELQNRGV